MGKRLKNLSPLGRVIADEVVCLGISVRNLCAKHTSARQPTTSCLKETPFRDGTHQAPALHADAV